MITWFDPQPDARELPARVPSPFATTPHPLARRAVDLLLAQLPAIGEGKMFGVLVVRAPDGRLGYLRAFSGMLAGSWHAPGFVPPAFDEAARAAFWPAGEAELAALEARERALRDDPVHDELYDVRQRQERERFELSILHADRRAKRHAQPVRTRDVERQARADTAERRALRATQTAEVMPLIARERARDREADAFMARRADRSRELTIEIYGTYRLANARGEVRSLPELFAPNAPPGGAGDCAAPKLFAYAYREGLAPVALAEVWCGPPAHGRHTGACYPACRGKCGPILAHVLGGLDAEPAPMFGDAPIADDEPRVLWEDERIAIVAKPCGLLSVPGRGDRLRDSVATRLAERYGTAFVVHRLDLDVSGVMLVAKDAATHRALQARFARREIDKRYVAVLAGAIAEERGTIELPLRVDLDDRPRQIVDPIHGKAAVTTWRVLARDGDRTRVMLVPHTGRTHQLRVHCAAALAPIIGDRLYGTPGGRLMLHAEAIAFEHPHTGDRIAIELLAPF